MGTILCMRIGTAEESETFLECPTISNGSPPYCECKYGPKYDEVTNTCPNPVCPLYDSTGIYPNCTCLHKNFDYSIYLNECFRVCPEDSSGYWPNCDCDTDGYVFVKSRFECVTCPLGSTGQYPDCDCGEDSAMYNSYDNSCDKCENESFGIYPNCSCSDGNFYDSYVRGCVLPYSEQPIYELVDHNNMVDKYGLDGENAGENNDYTTMSTSFNNYVPQCPYESIGVYPKCVCEGNSTYREFENLCIQCPLNSLGVYPNCICETNGTYIIDQNFCYTCPSDSTGEYPNCSCTHPFQYVMDGNICFGCPANRSGIYPNCECKNGFFSKVLNRCIECPENSIGFYPDCKCKDQGFIFSAFINMCYIMCPDNSSGIHPHCNCDGEQFYDEFMCKSNVGRKCPVDSIGIGPDCLCMREKFVFDSFYWSCMQAGVVIVAGGGGGFKGSAACPDNSGKWPQCDASIERNTLISLIG